MNILEILCGLVRINVVREGAAVNGVALQVKGSSWLEYVRGIMGSNIIHKHRHTHTENPFVLQLQGKNWGADWQKVGLSLGSCFPKGSVKSLCTYSYKYTHRVYEHPHKNRDDFHPVKPNPHLQCTHTCRYKDWWKHMHPHPGLFPVLWVIGVYSDTMYQK